MTNKNYDLIYLPTFRKDLNEIVYYITYVLQNRYAAERLLIKIQKAIIERNKNPKGYEKYKNNYKKSIIWYRIYVKNFTIYYTVEKNVMLVSRVLYRKRNFKNLI